MRKSSPDRTKSSCEIIGTKTGIDMWCAVNDIGAQPLSLLSCSEVARFMQNVLCDAQTAVRTAPLARTVYNVIQDGLKGAKE
jgi:hypothetical protein